ncbi:MAG TPA: sulfotransferase [Verrucomicrobiae bacterium]|jgi:Flp pilus assembly protein TadD|nr:sulfotransferase [Verrucomicrobiae bacterium]
MAHAQSDLTKAREFLLYGDYPHALALYQKLTRQSSVPAVVWYEYGNAAFKSRQMELADRAWSKAIELEPRNAELVGMIGHQYEASRRTDKARACFIKAAAAEPRGINPRISLAVLLEKTHRLGEARAAVDECLAIDPKDDQARYFLAVLDRREGRLEAAERGLRDLIASNPRHPYVSYAARYELAQVLDRTERFDKAMLQLTAAKEIVHGLADAKLLRQGYDQSSESIRRFTASQPKDILRTWAKFFPERKREAIPPLAFLGGHPRSGTTLLEQILDAHPSVAAVDESAAFLEVLQPEFHKSNSLSSARVNVLRRLYIQALLGDASGEAAGKFLIDKNPSPTSRLPLWLRVFPELRVLIALRDPRDVVLSCYFQNIALNSANVNFLSLERLAKHYGDLMGIWLMVREWPGFAWMETRYEDVVADMSKEGRRVTEFLGLQWHADQERFHEKSGAKQLYSPTYQDVTLPVYKRSVARWRAYEKHLAPILPALEPFCRAFGYCALMMLLLTIGALRCGAGEADDWRNKMATIIPRGYVCRYTATPIVVDGKLDDAAWADAPWTDDFVDIQDHGMPKPRFGTRAKMLWGDQYLYIGAQIEEPHVWATLTEHDSVIFQDPDFEVFMDPDGDTHAYYEFEMNALDTTWDLMLDKPYMDKGTPNNAWEIPGDKTAVHVNGTLNNPADTDQGWTVEIAFPWKVLGEHARHPGPPTEGEQWRIDFSRVEWHITTNGGAYQKVPRTPEDNWVWSPTGVIDMHRPEMWGLLQFTRKPADEKVSVAPIPGKHARDIAIEIYYAERDFQKANDRWATNLVELAWNSDQLGAGIAAPVLDMIPDGFVCSVGYKDGESRHVWRIRQDRLLKFDEAMPGN